MSVMRPLRNPRTAHGTGGGSDITVPSVEAVRLVAARHGRTARRIVVDARVDDAYSCAHRCASTHGQHEFES